MANNSSSPIVTKVRWIAIEDERLNAAVTTMGPRQWKNIAEHVGTRNHVQCRQRWEKIAPGRKKGAWSWDEDSALIKLVNEQRMGDLMCEIKWPSIALQITGRNAKQCKHRYTTQLDPAIKKGEFSAHEESTMTGLLQTLGRNWAQISSHLPGRTPNMIKNFFKRQERKDRNGSSPTSTKKRKRSTSSPVAVEYKKQVCVKLASNINSEHKQTCIITVCKQLDELLDDVEKQHCSSKTDELEWLDSLGDDENEIQNENENETENDIEDDVALLLQMRMSENQLHLETAYAGIPFCVGLVDL